MSTQMRGSNFYTSSPGLNKQRNSKQVNANVESNSPFLENENKHENIESEFYGGTDNQGGYNLQELSGRPVQSSYIPEQFYQNSGQQPGQPQPIPISGKEQPIAGQNQSVIEPIDKTKLLKEDLNVFINIFKGLEGKQDKEIGEVEKDKNNSEDGVDKIEVINFLKYAKPQLDQGHQEILTDFLNNFEKNVVYKNTVNMIDLQNIMDNIGLSENEKNLNTEQMTTMFSNLDRKRTRTFGIDDLFEAYKENFNGHPGLKDEYRKLLAYISPSGEINSEDFYNLMNNEKLFRNDFY